MTTAQDDESCKGFSRRNPAFAPPKLDRILGDLGNWCDHLHHAVVGSKELTLNLADGWLPDLSIVIDTREQRPYDFADTCRTTRETLPAGDYSIAGAQRRFAVERKSCADAYQSFTKHRERFVRELERLADYEYAAIVLEFDYAHTPPAHVVFVRPESVVGSLVAWSVRYGVHVWFASGRAGGRDVVLRLAKAWMARERKEA